jgi:hypothetical protein
LELVRRRPFEPIELCLSDGRAVVVRHPDQIIVSERHVILGLSRIKYGRQRMSTPKDGLAGAKDWMLIDIRHVVSAEPANGQAKVQRRSKR